MLIEFLNIDQNLLFDLESVLLDDLFIFVIGDRVSRAHMFITEVLIVGGKDYSHFQQFLIGRLKQFILRIISSPCLDTFQYELDDSLPDHLFLLFHILPKELLTFAAHLGDLYKVLQNVVLHILDDHSVVLLHAFFDQFDCIQILLGQN